MTAVWGGCGWRRRAGAVAEGGAGRGLAQLRVIVEGKGVAWVE